MKLTVLGKYGPYPKAGGGTTSYLLDCMGSRILLDAGSGCLSRLQQYCRLDSLDMVILTHLHADHCSDMLILRYVPLPKKLPVYLPASPETEHRLISADGLFEAHTIDESMQISLPDGRGEITFCKTIHPVECYAVRISTDDSVFVFTGDSKYSEALTRFCSDTDTLLIDSGFLSTQKDTGNLPHMYVSEAAETARLAGAGNLLLSHINPQYREEDILAEAAQIFPSSAIVQEGKSYFV